MQQLRLILKTGEAWHYIPEHWSVSNVTSSYPDHKPHIKAADYIAT
ncbi:hypothetical protein L1N82_04350 [Paenibacillus tarimensis]|nr:hypothetical protein [Paenibacillus tarimensis]